MKILIIMLLVASCSSAKTNSFKKARVANSYAVKVGKFCARDTNSYKEFKMCEEVFWGVYCRGNIIKPDAELCKYNNKSLIAKLRFKLLQSSLKKE